MNFSIVYSEIGKLMRYRDMENNREKWLQQAIDNLQAASQRLSDQKEWTDTNTDDWYDDAATCLLNICVIGNFKGLYISSIDHIKPQNDIHVISKTALAIAGNMDKLIFAHLAIPARAIYSIAYSEDRLNHVLKQRIDDTYKKIPVKKVVKVRAKAIQDKLHIKFKRIIIK